ncbi:MAG: hypothetical protein ABIQ89_03300 [Candidatus Saccharimonadales bacterium]
MVITLEVPNVVVDLGRIDPYDVRQRQDRIGQPDSASSSPKPIHVGMITERAAFSQPIELGLIDASDLPQTDGSMFHSFPIDQKTGRVQYDLPNGLDQFHEPLRLAIGHEERYYPGRRYRAALLTLHQSPVLAGTAQRSFWPKVLDMHWDSSDHNYGCADVAPTIHLVSDGVVLDRSLIQATSTENFPPGSRAYQAEPYEIVQSNAMSVHGSPIMEFDTVRTFFRLAYTYEIR